MTVLDAAHDYVRRGWRVVPLNGYDADKGACRCSRGRFCPEKNRGKHPVKADWTHLTLNRGPDVQAWYEDRPNDNVGILTGPESGIFVFDVDGAQGIRSVTDLAGEHGAMPSTRIIRTGSGGLHYFFRHPGHFTVRNSTSWIAPGVDIRGEGGQVVAPPSVSGRGAYEIIADHPLSEAPGWLLELLAEHSRNYESGRTTEVKGAEQVDMAVMPDRVRVAASTLVGEDQGRYTHFHSIVAACQEAGYTQGQTVTIVAPWCAAVGKFVGRVESEVARSWGKIQAAKQQENEWLGNATPSTPLHTTDGSAALATQPNPAPAPDPAGDDDTAATLLNLPPTWAPVDLEPILTGTYQPEEPALFPRTDDRCLVYPGRIHSFHGESESGKSLVVQAECARLAQVGSDVLYIDFESDAAAVVGRLLDLGATPDQLRTHLTYIRPDNDPRRFAHEREYYAALLASRYALIVIDGMTDALGTFGAGSTDNDEIAEFMRQFVRRLATSTGAAVIVIDHVTKDADSRGRWAVGGQAKMNALDGSAFMVEVVDALGRGLVGTVSLRVAKDRPGGVRPHCGAFRKLDRTQEAARIVVDSTGGRIRVTVQAPHSTVDSDPKTAKTFRPTVLMTRVSSFLEHAAEDVSQTTIVEGVTGKEKGVKQALAVLVAEGFVSTSEGPRKSTLHRLVRPYDPDQDPESDTYIGWTDDGSNQTNATPAPLPPRLPPGGVSDSRLASPSPTGEAGVNGGDEDATPAPPTPAPVVTKCGSCGRDALKVQVDAFEGNCATCAHEIGIVR